jgi:hypothetical protein
MYYNIISVLTSKQYDAAKIEAKVLNSGKSTLQAAAALHAVSAYRLPVVVFWQIFTMCPRRAAVR